MVVATFSLVAQDPDTGDLGVAVASKFLAVGAVVPHVWDEATEAAFLRLIGRENLEERYGGGSLLDEEVLDYLKERFGWSS
jgi:uncharacterized Ntn-hydrolase superfamily protein